MIGTKLMKKRMRNYRTRRWAHSFYVGERYWCCTWSQIYETKRDVILFCIDCSESMLRLYDDPRYEDVKTCHVYTALEAAMQIEKRKIIVGPNDCVGILLFNTVRTISWCVVPWMTWPLFRRPGNPKPLPELKVQRSKQILTCSNLYLPWAHQRFKNLFSYLMVCLYLYVICISHSSSAQVAREDPEELRRTFPPLTTGRIPMGNVFTSCNWVLRDGLVDHPLTCITQDFIIILSAPKTASKRVFLITDEDNPHPSTGSRQLTTSARTTLIVGCSRISQWYSDHTNLIKDLTQSGVTVEPFFISTTEKPFDVSKLYSVSS